MTGLLVTRSSVAPERVLVIDDHAPTGTAFWTRFHHDGL